MEKEHNHPLKYTPREGLRPFGRFSPFGLIIGFMTYCPIKDYKVFYSNITYYLYDLLPNMDFYCSYKELYIFLSLNQIIFIDYFFHQTSRIVPYYVKYYNTKFLFCQGYFKKLMTKKNRCKLITPMSIVYYILHSVVFLPLRIVI